MTTSDSQADSLRTSSDIDSVGVFVIMFLTLTMLAGWPSLFNRPEVNDGVRQLALTVQSVEGTTVNFRANAYVGGKAFAATLTAPAGQPLRLPTPGDRFNSLAVASKPLRVCSTGATQQCFVVDNAKELQAFAAKEASSREELRANVRPAG